MKILDYILDFLYLLNEMSPYLLLGFLFAGLMHVYIPKKIYSQQLSKNNFRSVFLSAIFGIPLPLCSCGVIPTAMSLRKEGASKGATISFLTATPQTGVDSILATYAILGLPFAIIRPFIALFTALLGGNIINKIENKIAINKTKLKENINSNDECSCGSCSDDSCSSDSCSCESSSHTSQGGKLIQAFKYGYVHMLQDIGKWLMIGIIISGIITILVPDNFFNLYSDAPILNYFVILLFSIPMYLCSTGSIPIAAALMLKGLSPGAALVLLMAGPATNAASLIVVNKVLGKKETLVYLFVIILSAFGFAYIIDNFLPHNWFNVASGLIECHDSTILLSWNSLFSLIFLILLSNAFIQKKMKKNKDKELEQELDSITYQLEGMHCNHCKNSVETNVLKVKGVSEAEVNLDLQHLIIKGKHEEKDIRETIESLGFNFKNRI